MKMGFVGAGRVGVSLGKLFAQNGLCITGYYSKTTAHALAAADLVGCACYESLQDLVRDSELVWLTVSDRAIAEVFAEISKFGVADQIVAHTSGALSAEDAFGAYYERGAAVHPIYPISDRFSSYRGLSDAFFCIEGGKTALSVITPLLDRLGLAHRQIAAEDKPRYHAACVCASNLQCALADAAVSLLGDCGFSSGEALLALAPLMRQNLEAILERGAAAALTGPVARNDVPTVQKHLAVLPDDLQALYRALSLRLVGLAEQQDGAQDYAALRQLLQE